MGRRLTSPRVRRDLTVVELDGESVVYDERTRTLHHLNATATVVFSLLDGSSTVSGLAGDLAGAFHLPADQIEGQIASVVETFRSAGLLEGSGVSDRS